MLNNYNQLIHKQFKINKRRSMYTILGVILGITLFITVGNLKIFINKINIEDSKINTGNYEAYFYNVNKNKVKDIESNVLIKDYALAALDSSEYINIGDIKKILSIYALDSECINNVFNKNMSLEEGNFPKKKGEVTLDILAKNQLNKSLGDEIIIEKNKYTIVGFFKGNKNNSNELNGITYFDSNNNYNNIIEFVNVKGENHIRENLLKIANDMNFKYLSTYEVSIDDIENNNEGTLNLNEGLIRCYENNNIFDFKNINETKLSFLFIDLAIVILTIILVLSSINISIKERIKYFATLRCIGATPEKIRYLLLKESLMLGILSIIPGVIIGYGVTYFVINIILKKIAKINFYGVNFSFYWSVTISSVILVGLIILISSILPVLVVGKIPPIEAIKIEDFKMKKIKKRTGKLMKKIFGYKGVLAYRNIRRNNKEFIITTLMLSSLLIILVLFTGGYNFMLENINSKENERVKDFTIYMDTNHIYDESNTKNNIKFIDNQFKKNEEIRKKLMDLGSIKNISSYINMNFDAFFTGIIPSDNFKNNIEIDTNEVYVHTPNTNILIYDDKSIKEMIPYVKSLTGKKINLNDFKNNGVILINPKVKNKDLKMKNRINLNIINGNKVQMYLKLYDTNSQWDKEKYNKTPIDINILGTIDSKNIIGGRNMDNHNVESFIVSKSFYEKYKSLILGETQYVRKFTRIDFDFLNKEERLKSLQTIKTYINEIGGEYADNYDYDMKAKSGLLALATLVYTTILFTMCIGIVNIINNKNINILLRKKELATMLAIGIKKEYLQKIIMLEGIIQWFISIVIAAIISCIVVVGVYSMFIHLGESINSRSIVISIITFLFGSVIFLIVNLISCKIALKSVKKFNIVQMLRSDE